ncbi:helix-turn-helix transcriptional regulator [Paracoccus tegillarcae]|uniref:HTH cro/C1-type domain-containing protein n=1 Tax=Paracoccus tegillarcae TaxID=1529068 RepID=A0A2K9F661_9RHOB|nr:helix-turn-helix transcriptional regulator [Paracoccus tegillarcae]AUH34661.1 hypothetical protein CUV01_15870 [Paracoccus tegillarcae]
MKEMAALDLRTARRNLGLTQDDLAHLLQCSEATIAKLESGRRLPNIGELSALALIYGRSFEGLFADVFVEVQEDLKSRLGTIPQGGTIARLRANRAHTLERLERRLEGLSPRL